MFANKYLFDVDTRIITNALIGYRITVIDYL